MRSALGQPVERVSVLKPGRDRGFIGTAHQKTDDLAGQALFAPRYRSPPHEAKSGEKSTAILPTSLMRMSRDGPMVSLKGSPTVSPMTLALWVVLPLPPKLPASVVLRA